MSWIKEVIGNKEGKYEINESISICPDCGKIPYGLFQDPFTYCPLCFHVMFERITFGCNIDASAPDAGGK